jgi:2-dehydro-3-deoxy-D-gluconate 5-dehydrogenase
MLSFQGSINESSYPVAKSGAAGITHILASEWAGPGINVIVSDHLATGNTALLRAEAGEVYG